MPDSDVLPPPLAPETDTILDAVSELRDELGGDPAVCVAILDGPVDVGHPCFQGADLRRVRTLVQDPAGAGAMSAHGTHVASVILGQPHSGTLGLAPLCRGLSVPVFRDASGHLSQLDLARAIEQAVLEGAHIVNVSGGERAPQGDPDPILARALDLCDNSNVLVVAAAGNDGSDCVHVPAAVWPALAVGALGRSGTPVPSSNFGEQYRANGVLAPGERIPGAVPGGGIAAFTGSSFATPIVSALAALLMTLQCRNGGGIDARAVRAALLESAATCMPPDAPECARYLAGTLDPHGARALILRGGTRVTELDAGLEPASAGVTAAAEAAPPPEAEPPVTTAAAGIAPSAVEPACTCGGGPSGATPAQAYESAPAPTAAVPMTPPSDVAAMPAAVVPVAPVSRVFAIGTIGFDFGTEARRDTFRQLMSPVTSADTPPVVSPPNPYDVRQLFDYLEGRRNDDGTFEDGFPPHLYDSTKLIWTLNLELTPIYAVEAEMPYAEDVYRELRKALRNQVLPADDPLFVSRVSIPGVLTTRTVELFSGQVVPVVVAQPRGLFVWNEARLVDAVVEAVDPAALGADVDRVRLMVRQMLDKVYYQLRNLGQSPPDRALNFQATNAFIFTESISRGLLSGEVVDGDTTKLYTLDTISVSKSPYCRVDSDCWDVQISFFDPENDNRARLILQSTIDVNDELPVQLAPVHQFLTTG